MLPPFLCIKGSDIVAKPNRQALVDVIKQITGIENYGVINKELKKIFVKFSISQVMTYLDNDKQDLKSIFDSKDFDNDFCKMRYFSAIVQNHLPNYKPPKPDVIVNVENEVYEHKYKPKAKRKCLNDFINSEEE